MRRTLENSAAEAEPETGERLEAVSIYLDGGKLTIGCEGDFSFPTEYEEYDFGGSYLRNGLEIEIGPETREQVFDFGVSWLKFCTGETDVQTWFGADPTITRKIL